MHDEGGGPTRSEGADRRPVSWAALATIAVAFAACGGGSGAATCAPAGTELRIAVTESATHRFDTKCLAAPADEPFTIAFTNDDTSAHGNHNVAIRDGAEDLFVGDVLRHGGTSTVYEIPPMSAGRYTFLCSSHPNMRGTFIVSNA